VGIWSDYMATLKSPEVEEPIDVYVHRPPGYLLARALVHTPATPNMVTAVSILLGLASVVAFVVKFPHHSLVAGGLLFASTVVDCADGQLARLRGTSSLFGRQIDGAADSTTQFSLTAVFLYLIWEKFAHPWWHGAGMVALCVAAAAMISFQLAMYDYYKNLFLRFTREGYNEGEDYDVALRRYEEAKKKGLPLILRITWPLYVGWIKGQPATVKRFDPYATLRWSEIPPFDPARGAIWRKHCYGLLKLWRWFFGSGTLMFSLAVFGAFEIPEWLGISRLLFWTVLYYAYMRPMQRRATRAAFREMGLAAA
jgi:phosphatidylglycerophosphate synthase